MGARTESGERRRQRGGKGRWGWSTPLIASQVKGLLKDHKLTSLVSAVFSSLAHVETQKHVSFSVMELLVENLWGSPDVVAESL